MSSSSSEGGGGGGWEGVGLDSSQFVKFTWLTNLDFI